MELAEWRRDHQIEWSRECVTVLDPDPEAWFAAFKAWIGFIKTARDAKTWDDSKDDVVIAANTSSDYIETTAATPNDNVDIGKSTSVDRQMCLKLPGSYPEESGEIYERRKQE